MLFFICFIYNFLLILIMTQVISSPFILLFSVKSSFYRNFILN